MLLHIEGISEDGLARINRNYAGLNKIHYFSVTPRILPAGRKNRITVKCKDENISLDGTYKVLVFPYYDYEYQPFEVQMTEFIDCQAIDGTLAFDYDFSEEQLYLIIIGKMTENEISVLLRTEVYALKDDLFSLKPLLGDFHSHTFHSDGLESPESVLRAAIALKLDFLAITDHNNYQGSVEAKKIADSKHLPITVINGEEYTSTFTNMHIISLGASAPLDPQYYWLHQQKEHSHMSVAEMTGNLCKRIHENGGVSVLCHPLWKPLRRDGVRLDVPTSLVAELLESVVFDAVEIVGGSPVDDYVTSNNQHILAVTHGATPDKVAYLGSTDSHTYSIDPICGKHLTLVFAEKNEQKCIVDAVRNRRTVAVQIINETNVLCYGTPRYCMFAQFYMKAFLQKEL